MDNLDKVIKHIDENLFRLQTSLFPQDMNSCCERSGQLKALRELRQFCVGLKDQS